MRKYYPVGCEAVDLDDPKTYERIPDNIEWIINKLYHEIGYTQIYIIYRDWNHHSKDQVKRINDFIAALGGELKNEDNWSNLLFWKEKLFLFQDEIENLI